MLCLSTWKVGAESQAAFVSQQVNAYLMNYLIGPGTTVVTASACTFSWALLQLLLRLAQHVFSSVMKGSCFPYRVPTSSRLDAVRTDTGSGLSSRDLPCAHGGQLVLTLPT